MYPLVLVHDLRPVLPWTVYALPVDIPGGSEPQFHERRFAVKWDEDNDERVLGAVLAAYYAEPESIWGLYAVSESKGRLSVFAQDMLRQPIAVAAWQRAIRSPCIRDSWDLALEFVDRYREIRTGGARILEALTTGEPTRSFTRDYDPLNALVELFDLGPTGPRREWKWVAPS
jgi:hypothetical protein